MFRWDILPNFLIPNHRFQTLSTCIPTTRQIKINKNQSSKFCSNEIHTCKYNFISFLPKFLFDQFRRYSNIFFLVVTLLQQIPDVSPTGKYTTAVPFSFILLISAISEIFEDLKRRRMDYIVNNYLTLVLRKNEWKEIEWKNVKVGDIVKVTDGQVFPADVILLTSSEHHGLAYIVTSNLDGETNLKIRHAPIGSIHYNTIEKLEEMNAEIKCEGPNKDLTNFSGTLTIDNRRYVLKSNELLLRGAKLKNTAWIYGAVVYTGHDAKLLRNSKTAPLKSSTINTITNYRILFLFVVLVILSVICGGIATIYNKYYLNNVWFRGNNIETNYGWNVLTFFLLYHNLIPISLQVTLELVRFFQAFFISRDNKMYDEESDTSATARTSNLNEELGLVQYIMTDKTGTLTRNFMKLKRCSVQGINYGNDEDDSFRDFRIIHDYKNENSCLINHFLTLMAVCHTIVPKMNIDGRIEYHGSSPDETAIVRSAAELGIVFQTRTPEFVVIKKLGENYKYYIDYTIHFNSDRKRSSVIVHDDDGNYVLYTKGADNVMLALVKEDQEDELKEVEQHLSEYSENGYRTLCFAYRSLDYDFYKSWEKRYSKAVTDVPNDEELIANLEDEIEKDFTFLGATAIEDKLQDYVPETIMAMKEADIKVWMLTGDKKETAINIAQSSSLIDSETRLYVIQHEDDILTIQPPEETNFSLAISGDVVKDVISSEHENFVKEVMLQATTVVCYRLTPSQKAEIVEMVRKASKAVVLSIGDGANDVAMIQAANVGVGIIGQEGLQAASSSDYSIAQFHFLRRLLLVHGAFNHDRTVKVILYSFYKNICFTIIQLWFALFSGFSEKTFFDRWMIAAFNVIFTAFPPIMLGLFDRPIESKTILKYPQLYRILQENSFSNRIFGLWLIQSIWHSLILFFLTYFILGHSVLLDSNQECGWLTIGCSTYAYAIATLCLKAFIEANEWTFQLILSCIASMISWFIFMIIYSQLWSWFQIGAEMNGMAWILMTSPIFWFGFLFVPIVTLLIDVIFKCVKTIFFPSSSNLSSSSLCNIRNI